MKKAISVIVFFYTTFSAFSQLPVQCTVVPPEMKAVYLDMVKNPAGLYNGRIYRQYAVNVYENAYPYFLTPDFSYASIVYDGKVFDKVPMRYDVITNEIVVLHPNRLEVSLVKERVTSFAFLSHSFRQRNNDPSLAPGFYDELYCGNSTVLAAYSKTFERNKQLPDTEGFWNYIGPMKEKYYIFYKGKFREVLPRKSALKSLFKGNKNVMKLLRNKAMDVKSSPASALVAIAKCLDQSV